MDAQKAINAIWKNVCLKCKYVERNFKCTACQDCEYNFAIDAIAKVSEYEKIGLSPKRVREVLADRNCYAIELAKQDLNRMSRMPVCE